MAKYRRKRFYGTPTRILLHLSSKSPDYDANLGSLTQEGIAGATLSARPTVTKWLRRLEGRGLLHRGRRHVPGHRVRRTVYSLTEQGWMEARRLGQLLASDVIQVRVREAAPVSARVKEIPDLFPGLVLPAIVSSIRRGRLVLKKPPAPPDRRTEEPLVWGRTMRTLSGGMVGRSEEIRTLDDWFRSPASVLAVIGLPGIGKSTLVATWLQRRPRGNVFWMELRQDTSPEALWTELAAFLSRMGRRSLAEYLAEAGPTEGRRLAPILTHAVRNLWPLVVVDNVQSAHPELLRLLNETLLPAFRLRGVKVVLTSRALPAFLSRPAAREAFGADVLRLGGLDIASSISLLRARGYLGDETTGRRLASDVRGHPLLLSLVAADGTAAARSVRDYLEREVWHKLSPPERRVLETAAIFRRVASPEALRAVPRASDSAIASLEAKALIERTRTGDVVVHDLVREFVCGSLRPERHRQLHRFAADYLVRRLEPRKRLEALYHFARAGLSKQAAELLEAAGPSFLDSGAAREFPSLLRDFDVEKLEASSACLFLETLGDSRRVSGELAVALMEYRRALRRCETGGRPERLPRLLRKIAAIERCRNEYPKALGHLVEAQARLAVHPDPAEASQVLREMALVERAQGNVEVAIIHLNQAIDLATDSSSPESLANGLVVLGKFETQRGNLKRALEHKLEALRIAEKVGSVTEAARASIAVATSYADLGEYAKSLPYHERGLQLARLVGNLRLIAYASMNYGAAVLNARRYREAGVYLKEARDAYMVLEERDALAILEVNRGEREMGLGRWGAATRIWRAALNTLRELNNDYDLMIALDAVARFYENHGDDDLAREHLLEALPVARKLKNDPRIAEFEARLQKLSVKQTPESEAAQAVG